MSDLPWHILRAAIVVLICGNNPVLATNWHLSAPSSVLIDTTSYPCAELSGVTYVGPTSVAGHHQFLAVQNTEGKLVRLDVELDQTGKLIAADAVALVNLEAVLDFEGIAYTDPMRNSVFLAEEGTPGVREFDLTTGIERQNVSVDSVFANRRNNYGFESLTRSPAGTSMWTANEEALTADGSRATATAGTTVRLQQLEVSGNDVSAIDQYAYEVDPIHVAGIFNQRRSGLSDLVALPDGTLLALERSFDFSFSAPLYRSRVYEINSSAATDISLAPFASGLIGQSFTPVDKELLWSGQVGGASGQNLEGLCLGPRLANSNWLLVGVVDNSSGNDGVSFNTLVTFELSPNLTADFDGNGVVDGRDFLAWQRGFGTSIGASLWQGDGDRDGDVDTADLAIWSAVFGLPLSATIAVPEPTYLRLLLPLLIAGCSLQARRYIVSLA